MLGGNYKTELLKYVDADQLADFLGGTNTAVLSQDCGPWNDYEIVDGFKKEDVVGVKHKETGEIFSVQDFENLPNYLVPNPKPVEG